jgi:hypothetical protein
MYTRPDYAALGDLTSIISDVGSILKGAGEAQTLVHNASSMFGNSDADRDRADRLLFVSNAVLAGSVLAGQFILGGLTPNGVGAASERAAWQAEYQQLLNDAGQTMALAQAAGPQWHYGTDTGSHPLSPLMRQQISADLKAHGIQYPTIKQGTTLYMASPLGTTPVVSATAIATATAPTGTTPVTTPTGYTIPGMTTTAPFNFMPWLVGGGVLAAALLLNRGRRL